MDKPNFADFKINPTMLEIESNVFCVPEEIRPNDKIEVFHNHDNGSKSVWITHKDGTIEGSMKFAGILKRG